MCLRVLRAPRQLAAVLLSVMAAMFTMNGVTTFYKASMHVMSASGTATVVVLLTGRRSAVFVLLAPLVAWSRLRLKRHTIGEIIVGALIGSSIPMATFRFLGIGPQVASELREWK